MQTNDSKHQRLHVHGFNMFRVFSSLPLFDPSIISFPWGNVPVNGNLRSLQSDPTFLVFKCLSEAFVLPQVAPNLALLFNLLFDGLKQDERPCDGKEKRPCVRGS